MAKRSLQQLEPNIAATPSPLRFYDPEIQNAWNTEPCDNERIWRANQKAKELNNAYIRQLEVLSGRMSNRTFSMFSDPQFPLFDADLLEFSFGDALGFSAPRKRAVALSSSVKLSFRSFDEKALHFLSYSRIKAINVDYPGERWFSSPNAPSRVDSLLANELTAVDAQLMKHAFLFVSGTLISIEFERVRWETRRIRLP